MRDPKNILTKSQCTLIKSGTLTTLCPGMRYDIYLTSEGEVYGETFTCQFFIKSSLAEFNKMNLFELERYIYSRDQSVAR